MVKAKKEKAEEEGKRAVAELVLSSSFGDSGFSYYISFCSGRP